MVTRTSPGWIRSISSAPRRIRAMPPAIPGDAPKPANEWGRFRPLAARLDGRPSGARRRGRRDRGHGTSLDDVEGILVGAPLDVHRAAILRFDDPGQRDQSREAVVGELLHALGVRRNIFTSVPSTFGSNDSYPLLGYLLVDGLEARPVDDVMVRGHLAADDRLPEAPAGLDDHVVLPGVRVPGEQDPAHDGIDHLLDEDGEVDLEMVETFPLPVDEDAGREERAPATLHRSEDGIDPRHVQVGVLQPREGRPFEVLGGRARTHGRESHVVASDERFVRGHDLGAKVEGELRPVERLAEEPRRDLGGLGFLGVDLAEDPRDLGLESGAGDVGPVGVGRDDEPGRDGKPLPDHFAELPGLPSDH